MRCPSCEADVVDPEAAFCARCGRPLGRGSSDAQRPEWPDLSAGRPDDTHADSKGRAARRSSSQAPPAPPPDPEETGAGRAPRDVSRPRHAVRRSRATLAGLAVPVRDIGAAVTRSVTTGGWLDACKAACVAFLATLCVGALLLVAAKLASPKIGSGASPASVLTGIVILAVGALGAPIHIGDVSAAAFPLGALALIGAAISWSTAKVVRTREITEARSGAAEGVKIAVPYALLVWAAALIFRLRAPPTPVAASAGRALLLAAIWGALFGAMGGARAGTSVSDLLTAPFRRLRQRSPWLYLGTQTGAAMLMVVGLGAVVALFLWIIVALARGSAPPSFGVGDAVAGVVFIAAFLPNILVSLVGVALGAPIEVGAKVKFGGRSLGPLESFSLSDWGGDSAPVFVWLLVLIPLVACFLGGFAARRNANDTPRVIDVLCGAVLVFAVPLGVLAALADARLGAGLVRARGFAHVAPGALSVLALAAVWAAGMGFLGWKIAESQSDARAGPLRAKV